MKRLRNSAGQMTIEAVLIMAVCTSIALFVIKTARNGRWAASLVEGPWQPIRGMIEDGVWENAGKSKLNHPANFKRHHSNLGSEVKGT